MRQVYSEGSASSRAGWQGPYKLLAVTGTRTILQLPSGPTVFPTTHVKRCYEERENKEEPLNEENSNKKEIGKNKDLNNNSKLNDLPISPRLLINKQTPSRVLRSSSRIRRLTEKAKDPQEQANRFHATRAQLCINLVNNDEEIFAASRQKELRGLLDMNVFEPVPLSSVPQGTRIFDSHFVDEMKMPGTAQAYPRSRLVVQAFKDEGKVQVLTQSPTLQRVSQRILLSISVSLEGHSLYLLDITQAYVQ